MSIRTDSLWEFDRERYRVPGFSGVLCGIDEAGRGPLAGPVVAACAVCDPERPIAGIDDSKKLLESRREAIFEALQTAPGCYWGVGMASPEEIDRVNILQATFLAMRRAYDELCQKHPNLRITVALVDGNRPPELPVPVETLVKGDGRSACIAVASILAKVTRDRLMREMDLLYPQYQFARHKGYPTALHYETLRKHGISPIHRRSFLKTFLAEECDATERAAVRS